MDVLGDVGQKREETECPDHVKRRLHIECVEDLDQLRIMGGGSAGIDGQPTDLLDDFVHLVADLLPDDVTDQTANQPDVVVELGILLLIGSFHPASLVRSSGANTQRSLRS